MIDLGGKENNESRKVRATCVLLAVCCWLMGRGVLPHSTSYGAEESLYSRLPVSYSELLFHNCVSVGKNNFTELRGTWIRERENECMVL